MKSSFAKRLRRAFRHIHLVDKCLLVFMAILLLQSAYSLISGGTAYGESNHIDVIIRTSAAGIFGYFISANFIREAASPEHRTAAAPQQTESIEETKRPGDGPQNQIGFALPAEPTTLQTGKACTDGSGGDSDGPDAGSLQIITAACIGIFCLIALILVRNFSFWDGPVNASVTATVAQLRDFVSGSVGFLIGNPTSERNDTQ